jgi:hypothetical protein
MILLFNNQQERTAKGSVVAYVKVQSTEWPVVCVWRLPWKRLLDTLSPLQGDEAKTGALLKFHLQSPLILKTVLVPVPIACVNLAHYEKIRGVFWPSERL